MADDNPPRPHPADTKAPPASPPSATAAASPAPSAATSSRFRVGPRALKLLWDGHSVAGVVIGLGLFVIFFAGAFALYRGELHQWADPALRSASTEVASADALIAPLLDARPPAQGTELLFVYPFANRPYAYLGYETETGDEVRQWINPATAETLPALGRSALSDLLYHLHFYYQLGVAGELLSGLVAEFFLFVLISGLLIHLRNLPKDLHTFRSQKGLRVALTDAHNVLGTIGLPFTVMYAVTGAFFSLLTVILAPYVLVVFDGDRSAVEGLSEGIEMPAVEPTGRAAPMPSLDQLAREVSADWPEDFSWISYQVHGWGDEAAVAVLRGDQEGSLTRTGAAVVEIESGRVLSISEPANTPPLPATISAFGKLHFARFGGPVLKALFFLLTLAACAVILTGNLLWIEIRRPSQGPAPRLHRVLARLTAGVGAGLVAAVPILFLTTRAVPLEVDGRMAIENAAFFGSWALLIGAAFFGSSAARAAQWQLALAGGLSLLVPLANGMGTGAWPWVSASQGTRAVFGVDVGFALGGVLVLALAARLQPSSKLASSLG